MVAGYHWMQEFAQFLVLRFACMAPQKLRLKGTVHTNMTFLFQTCMAFFLLNTKDILKNGSHWLPLSGQKYNGSQREPKLFGYQVALQNFRYVSDLGPHMKVAWDLFEIKLICDCHKKIRYGSHLGKKVGFGPLQPAVWTKSNILQNIFCVPQEAGILNGIYWGRKMAFLTFLLYFIFFFLDDDDKYCSKGRQSPVPLLVVIH